MLAIGEAFATIFLSNWIIIIIKIARHLISYLVLRLDFGRIFEWRTSPSLQLLSVAWLASDNTSDFTSSRTWSVFIVCTGMSQNIRCWPMNSSPGRSHRYISNNNIIDTYIGLKSICIFNSIKQFLEWPKYTARSTIEKDITIKSKNKIWKWLSKKLSIRSFTKCQQRWGRGDIFRQTISKLRTSHRKCSTISAVESLKGGTTERLVPVERRACRPGRSCPYMFSPCYCCLQKIYDSN